MASSLTTTTTRTLLSRTLLQNGRSAIAISTTRSSSRLLTSYSSRSLQQPQRQLQLGCAQHATAILCTTRAQSTWVAPSKRGRRYAQTGSASSHPRRPIVNGKSVAFHVKDLELQQTFTTHHSENDQTSNTGLNIQPVREYESDLVVVLDMDECLIHSQFLQGPGAKYAHQVRSNRALGKSAVDTFMITLPDGELVKVHERPHLRDFLERVTEKYETHIFTAAMEVYAKPVLQTLDPSGTMFTHCWYRDSCRLDSSVGAYVKPMNMFGDNNKNGLKRTVLVDNNPLSFLANPTNGILVSSFYNDPEDTTLPAVLDLLEELDELQDDVRPVLDARFGLKQALDEIQSGRGRPSWERSSLTPQREEPQEAEEEEEESQRQGTPPHLMAASVATN